MIYLTAIGLTRGGSSTVHIYTQTIHRTTHFNIEQYNVYDHRSCFTTKSVTEYRIYKELARLLNGQSTQP